MFFSTYINRFFCVGRLVPGLYIKKLTSIYYSQTVCFLQSKIFFPQNRWCDIGSSDVSFSSHDLTGTGEVRGGEGHGAQDQRLWLPGVLGQDQGRREGGVRDGHQGSSAGQETMQEKRLRSALKLRLTRGGGRRGVGRS